MPRGSKPGERRGGRKRATPNKRTLLRERILAHASTHPNATTHDLFLMLVSDLTLPADIRLAVGRKLFSAERRRSVSVTRPVRRIGDREAACEGRAAQQSKSSPIAIAEPGISSTLDLLVRIAQDTGATPEERRKAASEVARHILPQKVGAKKSGRAKFVTDDCGFSDDPKLAKELRDVKLEQSCLPLSSEKLSPYAFTQKVSALEARIREIQQSLQCPCPSKYRLKYYIDRTEVDAEIIWDREFIKIFQKRRVDKASFTAEEDLEEAIRMARYDSFVVGPEMAARRRLADLRRVSRAALHGGTRLTPSQAVEFRFLSVIHPAEMPAVTPEYEEALERLSEFSTCEFDTRGFVIIPNFARAEDEHTQSPPHTHPDPGLQPVRRQMI
jgi:hypothetical protein